MRRYTEADFTDAFWQKVEKTNSCWLWLGLRNRKGYGAVRRNRRMVLTHRVSWEMANGPIPARELVLHHCDMPHCVRPDHLWLGDQAANMRDMVSKGRQNRPIGSRHHRSRLSESLVRDIRVEVASGTPVAAIARRLGLSWATVGHAASGRSWRHVE